MTGEPTTCRDGAPHEWLPLPCNCGPNDRRRGDRRQAGGSTPTADTEGEEETRRAYTDLVDAIASPSEGEGAREALGLIEEIEVRIMEFGDNPKEALSLIIEFLDRYRHSPIYRALASQAPAQEKNDG